VHHVPLKRHVHVRRNLNFIENNKNKIFVKLRKYYQVNEQNKATKKRCKFCLFKKIHNLLLVLHVMSAIKLSCVGLTRKLSLPCCHDCPKAQNLLLLFHFIRTILIKWYYLFIMFWLFFLIIYRCKYKYIRYCLICFDKYFHNI
jgi:hypothetical protein